jgi:hypothetical protein
MLMVLSVPLVKVERESTDPCTKNRAKGKNDFFRTMTPSQHFSS